jgi:hypothetical protein
LTQLTGDPAGSRAAAWPQDDHRDDDNYIKQDRKALVDGMKQFEAVTTAK